MGLGGKGWAEIEEVVNEGSDSKVGCVTSTRVKKTALKKHVWYLNLAIRFLYRSFIPSELLLLLPSLHHSLRTTASFIHSELLPQHLR